MQFDNKRAKAAELSWVAAEVVSLAACQCATPQLSSGLQEIDIGKGEGQGFVRRNLKGGWRTCTMESADEGEWQ